MYHIIISYNRDTSNEHHNIEKEIIMETFDVFFTSEGIELETLEDHSGYTRHAGMIPHI